MRGLRGSQVPSSDTTIILTCIHRIVQDNIFSLFKTHCHILTVNIGISN